MAKRSREHSSDEFGKQGSGLAGTDAPMIGAAGAIFSDALTERESGVTPGPPPISVRALVLTFVVMFAIGAAGLSVYIARDRADVPPDYRFSYSSAGTGTLSGNLDGPSQDSLIIGTGTSETPAGESYLLDAVLAYDSSTVFLINGRPLSVAASGEETLTVYELNGWPCTVEYERVAGSERPRATRVEFTASESEVQELVGNP